MEPFADPMSVSPKTCPQMRLPTVFMICRASSREYCNVNWVRSWTASIGIILFERPVATVVSTLVARTVANSSSTIAAGYLFC